MKDFFDTALEVLDMANDLCKDLIEATPGGYATWICLPVFVLPFAIALPYIIH